MTSSFLIRSSAWGLAAAGFARAASSLTHAQAFPDAQAQLDDLTKRLAELENRQSAPAPSAAASNTVTGGALPGSFKLRARAPSVKLGGHGDVSGELAMVPYCHFWTTDLRPTLALSELHSEQSRGHGGHREP